VSKGRSREIAVKLNARLRDARPKPGQDPLGHAEGTEARKTAKTEGAESPESGSDLHERVGGDEGT
jgi:hypothetical protein